MFVRVDVPKELDACVESIGGVLLDDDHGSRDPTKADYWFPKDNVIGELKCLSADLLADQSFTNWLNMKYVEWVGRNLAVLHEGRTVANLADLPQVCTDEVTSFLRDRLDRSLKKANSQIKNSRKVLQAPSALGLVILVNDGDTALPSGMIQNIIIRTLPYKFSGINSVIHFTANMPCQLPGIEQNLLVWADWNAKSVRPAVQRDLINRLKDAWLSRFATMVGGALPTLSVSVDTLYDMRFLKIQR